MKLHIGLFQRLGKLCQLLVRLRLCHLFRDDLEEELNGAPAIHGKLAADKVHSLHPIRAFVDHGDAGIADILLHARFHDVAVTAKHLLRIGCDFIALVSAKALDRSEEHTSELQSLMRTSYAVCCLKKKTDDNADNNNKI